MSQLVLGPNPIRQESFDVLTAHKESLGYQDNFLADVHCYPECDAWLWSGEAANIVTEIFMWSDNQIGWTQSRQNESLFLTNYCWLGEIYAALLEAAIIKENDWRKGY